jgi:hypothetical protein
MNERIPQRKSPWNIDFQMHLKSLFGLIEQMTMSRFLALMEPVQTQMSCASLRL